MAAAARSRLTDEAATYYETTAVFPPARDNERAWGDWRFVPHVGRDVGSVSTAIELFGVAQRAPVLLAPCAFAGYADPDGEHAVARAAAATETTFVVSASSSSPPDEVARTAPGRGWLQVYVPHDDEQLAARVTSADDAGFGAIVVTLDSRSLGAEHRAKRIARWSSTGRARRSCPHAIRRRARPRALRRTS